MRQEFRLFDRFRVNLREYGLKSILRSLDWRTPRWLLHYSHALVTRGSLEIGETATKEGIEFRLASDADAELFQNIGVSKEIVHKRLKAGDLCGIALTSKGTLVSMLWTATGTVFIEEVGHPLFLDPDAVYSYNAYTKRKERQKGLFKGCAKVVYDFHRSQGRKYVYGAVSIYNTPSQAAGNSIGRQVVGEVILLRIFGIEIQINRKWLDDVPRIRVRRNGNPRGLRRI